MKAPTSINSMKTAWMILFASMSGHLSGYAQDNANPPAAPGNANQVDPKSAARFRQYDRNQDQAIDFAEFQQGPFSRREDSRGVQRDWFTSIDRNGDDQLSPEEYAEAKKHRDNERIHRGKKKPPEESRRPDGAAPRPALETTPNPDGTLSGKWRSQLLKKRIPCTVRFPVARRRMRPRWWFT